MEQDLGGNGFMIPPPPPDDPPPTGGGGGGGGLGLGSMGASPRYTGSSSAGSSPRFQEYGGNNNNHGDGGNNHAGAGAAYGGGTALAVRAKDKKERAAEKELRMVAETLSKTGKVLNAGLAQANEQGQRLRGAISRLERGREWSSAERTRAQDEIKAYFHNLHEVLRAKEAELLRDCKGVYEVQDDDQNGRLEELVHEGQRLSKACAAIQGLNEGTGNATLGSLNEPLNALLEALESSAQAIEREDEMAQQDAARVSGTGDTGDGAVPVPGGGEDRGVKFYFCQDKEIQRAIEGIEMVHFEQAAPPVVLVGTPAAVDEEAQRRRLLREGASGHAGRGGPSGGSPRGGDHVGGLAGLGFDESSAVGTPYSQQQQQQQQQRGPRQAQNPSGKLAGATPRRFSGEMDNNGATDGSLTQTYKIKAVIPFEDDEDQRGVVHYLGTRGNTQVFSNPALFSPDDPFLIVLRASSRIEGDLASLSAFKHHDGAFFETDSALSSWVSVELPSPMAPSHYTLGYYVNGQDHIPRNWVLQGSKDNTNWATLKVHENDTSLDGKMHLATWRVPERAVSQAGPFRYFRVMQTGPTSTGTMFLVLSFLELYGTLFTEAEA